MPTPIANAAINTFLKLSDGNSPETFVTVANVGDITGPSFAGAVVDVTSHSTGNAWRQKIVTLLDPGTVTFPLFFIPNDSGHQRLQSVFVNRGLPTAPASPADFQLSFPTSPSRTVYTFSAFISKFNMDAKVADVIRSNMELVLTGEPQIPGVNA
jgi:Lambda phage tail tube protein, TTP